MPRITSLRDAIVSHLETQIPNVRVDALTGGLNLENIMQDSIGRESMLVMALSAQNKGDLLDFDIMVAFAVIVLVRGRGTQINREADGLAMAEDVALALHGQKFGFSDVSPAKVYEIAPIEDNTLSSKGLWAWAVTFEQGIVLGE